jgi:hypothetical protein
MRFSPKLIETHASWGRGKLEADVDAIARALIHAEHVVHEGLGRKLDGSRDDLRPLQELLDSSTAEREATYTLQALGLAFGRYS